MHFSDIAWDFDGTLCNSYPHILKCFHQALNDFGIEDSDEHILKQITATVEDAASYYQKNFGAPDTLLERFHWYDRTLDYDSFRPYPGVKEMLGYICESKRRNHLFTHRNNQVLEYLRHYQLLDYFTIKITGDDHLPFKPAPDGLLSIMRQGNILPDNLLMVGDRSIDIDSAWNATVHSLFFNSNNLPIPEHATYTITSYSEMKRYL